MKTNNSNSTFQQLNIVMLRGYVGKISVKQLSGKKVARLSLATNYQYNDSEGNPIVETTWHNINAWEGKNILNLDSIKKGDKLYIEGRIRNYRYTDTSGIERTGTEILAGRIEKAGQDENV